MTNGRSWEGNIKARLYERVRERGYDSLTAIAEARPTASLVELANDARQRYGNVTFSRMMERPSASHSVRVYAPWA
jgi:hypothetical protein